MEPYGKQWKKEISKMTKAQIIELAARIGNEKLELRRMLEELQSQKSNP